MSGNGAISNKPYRYLLGRTWDERPRLLCVMLNPSTADDEHDDQTLRRCMNFSERWGYGGLEIVNLFAYRTPYPDELAVAEKPVGDQNDYYVAEAAARASAIVVAWGAWADKGAYRQRARTVLTLLAQHSGQQLRCLGTTQHGSPRHPLYIAGETALRDFL